MDEATSSLDNITEKEIYKTIISEDDTIAEAHAGLVKSLLAVNSLSDAKVAYEAIPEQLKSNSEIKSVSAQIKLTEQTSEAGKLEDIRKKFLLSPKDLGLKFELALALIAEHQNKEAIDTLLEIIQQDTYWNDGKAKKQIIELLDALGPENQEGRSGRRKLSSILFS